MNDDDLDRTLRALGHGLGDAPPPSRALEAALAGLEPVRTRRPARQLALALVATFAYAALITAVLTLRRDIDELPRLWVVVYALAWVAGFAVPIALALVPERHSVLSRARVAGLTGLASGAALAAIGWATAQAGPSSVVTPDGLAAFARHAWPCLLIGHATAIAPAVLGVWLLRRASPVNAGWIAAALGASGGAIGGLVLHLHCPIAAAEHVGFVHGAVMLLAAGWTALAARRALRP